MPTATTIDRDTAELLDEILRHDTITSVRIEIPELPCRADWQLTAVTTTGDRHPLVTYTDTPADMIVGDRDAVRLYISQAHA